MKKMYFLLFSYLFISNHVISQTVPKYTKDELKTDSLKIVAIQRLIDYSEKMSESYEQIVSANTKLTSDLATLNSSHNKLTAQSDNRKTQLNSLLTSKNKDSKDQYLIIKSNIINSAKTYSLSLKAIEQLEINLSTNIKNARDNQQSNPESGILGFKLSEKVEEFAKKNLFKKESNLTKFMNTVSSLTDSELIKSIAPAPALGVANSIINLLHGMSLNSKKVDVEKINKFEKDFTPYVLYFEKSSIADVKMISSSENLNNQLKTISSEIINHLNSILSNEKFRTDIKLSYKEQGAKESNVDFLRERKSIYTELLLDNYFDDLEKNNSTSSGNIDYEKILSNREFLKEVSNKMDKLIQHTAILEFIEKDYFNSFTEYNTSKIEALKIAPTNDKNEKTISDEILKTSSEYDDLIKKQKKAIDIKGINENIENSNYSIKLI